MEEIIKPIRKIRSSRSSLRGNIYSYKTDTVHDFESSLERDFIELLEFDSNVVAYIEQPITIDFEENGVKKSYTPDFLIEYCKTVKPSADLSPLLVEIKYARDLKKNEEDLKVKFKAATDYAEKKGWRFMVLTENEIRNDYLKNVKFLSTYKKSESVDHEDFLLLLDKIIAMRVTTPEELILAAARTDSRRAELLYTLWYMIANNYIACDKTNSLTMKSEIWL